MKLHYNFIILFFVLIPCILVEIAIAKKNKLSLYTPKACQANVAIFCMRIVLEYGLFLPMVLYFYQLLLIPLPHIDNKLNGFLYWFFLFLAQDFLYYWFHRISHYVPWMWAAHGVHHSDNDYNLFTPLRESPFFLLSGSFLFFIPLVLLGFHTADIILVIYCSLVFQFFLHTQLIHKLPAWIEFLFNTPSHHRVHHARDEQYFNKNFGGVLIIWDRLFGSFEKETTSPHYGWIKPYQNNNPFAIIFRPWITMFRSVLKYKNLKYFILFP